MLCDKIAKIGLKKIVTIPSLLPSSQTVLKDFFLSVFSAAALTLNALSSYRMDFILFLVLQVLWQSTNEYGNIDGNIEY